MSSGVLENQQLLPRALLQSLEQGSADGSRHNTMFK